MSEPRELHDGVERTDPATIERLRAAFVGRPVDLGEADPSEQDPVDPERIDPERIWAAVAGELPDDELLPLLDRLHRDPALALEWRLAMALRAEAEASEESARELDEAMTEAPEAPAETEAPTEAPPRPANDRGYGYPAILALVAAAVLAILVFPRDPDPSSPSPSPTIEPDGGTVLREAGTTAAITSELATPDLEPGAFTLRWSEVPGALRYELQLTTEALDPVWSADDLTANHASVPRETIEAVPAGTELVWRVTAVMPDGQRRSSAALAVTRK